MGLVWNVCDVLSLMRTTMVTVRRYSPSGFESFFELATETIAKILTESFTVSRGNSNLILSFRIA
jgi:hypothetical protein